MHALVPGGGPATDGGGWKTAKHPQHRRRKKPYLVDNVALGQTFRDHYLRGLKKLIAAGELSLEGSVAFLKDAEHRGSWLSELQSINWNVFIEGPPGGQSDPGHVVKYLARYLTGGPISDHRIISADAEQVHFWARPKKPGQADGRAKKNKMHAPEPFRLRGVEFVRRWNLHILPKGFVRTRSYGGYHPSKRAEYLRQCRELLQVTEPITEPASEPNQNENASETQVERKCPRCPDGKLELVHHSPRPSWREVFDALIYQSSQYSPIHHLGTSRAPP